MNPFTEGPFALPPDDALHLMQMVRDAHRPFSPSPFAGGLADEHERRWKKSRPKPPNDVAVARRWTMDSSVSLLADAYTSKGRPVEPAEPIASFDREAVVKLILAEWPGLALGQPERQWAQQPAIRAIDAEIAEINRHRELTPLSSGGLSAQVGR